VAATQGPLAGGSPSPAASVSQIQGDWCGPAEERSRSPSVHLQLAFSEGSVRRVSARITFFAGLQPGHQADQRIAAGVGQEDR
jgi:hypothetical protein